MFLYGKKRKSLIVLFILITSFAFGEDIGKTEWSWGIGVFSSSQEGEELYFAYSLPQMILAEIRDISQHQVGEEERESIIYLYRKDQRLTLQTQYNKKIKEYDQLIFKGDHLKSRTYKEDLEGLREELLTLEDRDFSLKKSLETLFTKGNQENLFSPEKWEGDPQGFIHKEKLDAFIYGVINIEGPLLTYSLLVSNPQDILFEQSGVFPYENISSSFIKEEFKELRRFWSGNLDSQITIETDDPQMEIFVNNAYIGTGKGVWEVQSLPLLIQGESNNQKVLQKIYTFTPEVYLEGKIKDSRNLLVETDPEKADVYINGKWQGITPLLVNISPLDQIFLSRTGYRNYSETGRERDLTISLTPEAAQDGLSTYRNKFYRSLTVFSFSLFPTLLLPEMYKNYRGLANGYYNNLENSDTITYKDYTQAVQLANALNYGRVLSLGISLSSFGWMMWDFIQYLKHAETLTY